MTLITKKLQDDQEYVSLIRDAFDFGRELYLVTVIKGEHIDIPDLFANATPDVQRAIDAGFESMRKEHELDKMFYNLEAA